MSSQKAIKIGDVICLYVKEKDETLKYTVNDICVYINDGGSYEIGFFVDEQKEPIPFFMYKELNNAGLMFKNGHDEIYKVLREDKKKNNTYFAERPIGDGECVTFDHSVNVFEVVIRSMSIGLNDLKDHIQKKYEVTNISEVSRTPCYKV